MSPGKILAITVVIVLAGLFCAYQYMALYIDHAIDEDSSPGWVSWSVLNSKERRVWVASPTLDTARVQTDEWVFTLKDTWIEQQVKVQYRWLFFRSIETIGYQMVVVGKFEYRDEASPTKRPWVVPIQCLSINGVTSLCGTTGTSDEQIIYGLIAQPFPKRVTVTLQAKSLK